MSAVQTLCAALPVPAAQAVGGHQTAIKDHCQLRPGDATGASEMSIYKQKRIDRLKARLAVLERQFAWLQQSEHIATADTALEEDRMQVTDVDL